MARPILDRIVLADAWLGEALFDSCKKVKLFRYVAGVISYTCDEIVWFSIPTVMFVGRLCLRQDATIWAGFFQEVCLVTAVEEVLKGTFRRQRPPYSKQSSFTCLPFEHYSFPSGHILRTSFIAYRGASVMAMGGAQKLSLGLWIAAAAWSRVGLGKHFPSDVAGGMILGVLLGTLPSRTLHAIISCSVAPFLLGEAWFLGIFRKFRPKGYFIHVGLALVGIASQFFTLTLAPDLPLILRKRIVEAQAVLGPLLLIWLIAERMLRPREDGDKNGDAYLKLDGDPVAA